VFSMLCCDIRDTLTVQFQVSLPLWNADKSRLPEPLSLFMTPSYKLPPIATLAAPRNPSLWTWPAKSRSEERTCQNQRRLQNQIRVIMSPY
jgi:hypothetical protein